MDYLFVPGNDAAERLGRQVLSRRPNTFAVTVPNRQRHVAGLLARLATLTPTQGNPDPRPIGDLLFVAHGLETGHYFLPLSRVLGSPADFERAEDANAADSIRLTAPLLTPAGGGNMNVITARLRGCNIGRARPFVEKLREAMTPAGSTLNMTAPLHFDEFHGVAGGTVEFPAHKFTVKANQPFRRPNGRSDRNALLTAFDTAAFTYLDGTAIPAADWTNWVPPEIHPPRARWKQTFDFDVDLDPPVGAQATRTMHREYRYETRRFTWDWGAADPGQHQRGARLRPLTPDERDILRDTLPQGRVPNAPGGRHLYDPAYPWPLYERYGFADLDDYVDNLDWQVRFDGRTLHYRAVSHEYTVMLPVTDPPAPPNLPVLRFYNFLPSRAAAGPPVLNLDETNADLFLIL